MQRYKAVLFAPDGDWTVDFRGDTKEKVKEQLANRGSRWFFYPLEGIILDKGGVTTNRQGLVDAAPPIEFFKGKSIKTVVKHLQVNGVELF